MAHIQFGPTGESQSCRFQIRRSHHGADHFVMEIDIAPRGKDTPVILRILRKDAIELIRDIGEELNRQLEPDNSPPLTVEALVARSLESRWR